MATFTPDFLDELRARLRASDVIGRYVKLQKNGREWRGLSPYTNEKTPSFYVNDEKARYFDFSSGKNGDIIGFMVDVQKLTFPEAVKRLAEEAGMETPKDTPEDARRAEQAKGLVEACEAAAQFFEAQLQRIEGRTALEYLHMRGVPEPLQRTFRLGYAPNSKSALKDYLINKGFDQKLLVEAGLLIDNQDGRGSYDRFRDRLMFPIHATSNKVIAFGGRALDKTAKAKYLNSPETPLFHKGNVLYNYMPARKAAADLVQAKGGDQTLLVCEGYMDVIALANAGFGHGVAPLGTALTENHLKLLWRACDEPIMCFDGDRAGRGAAYRSIDRALPLLAPGKSLRFAFLPEGQDPDDLVKAEGPGAFQKVLDGAQPLADVLWSREREAHPDTTPEKQAAFRSHLRKLVQGITDTDVKQAYGAYFSEKFRAGAAPAKTGGFKSGYKTPFKPGGFKKTGFGGGRTSYQPSAMQETKAKKKVPSVYEEQLVLVLANQPALFERLEPEIEDLVLQNPDLADLLQAIVAALFATPDLDFEQLHTQIRKVDKNARHLELLLENKRLKPLKFTRPTATLEEAEEGWRNAHSLFLANVVLRPELAEVGLESTQDDQSTKRWHAANTHLFAVVADGKTEPKED